ncbi:MAG: pentapeptide repeat-containing protein, partial [Fuerstiella sp.]|nr:pentapeptide repeat-containing protein [Fuerstiella sp.]
FRNADLSGADLSRANLEEADLSAACLRGANLKHANLSCRQSLLWRHLTITVLVTNRFNQQTLVRLTGHQRRTGVTARHDARAGIQSQATVDVAGGMTFVTMFHQNRPHILFKEFKGSTVRDNVISADRRPQTRKQCKT